MSKPPLASRRNRSLIDGEAVIARDDGTPDFRALRSQRRGGEAVLFAFDLIEHDGDDLRDLPLIERKRRVARVIGKAKRRAIRYNEHLTGDGPTMLRFVGYRARRHMRLNSDPVGGFSSDCILRRRLQFLDQIFADWRHQGGAISAPGNIGLIRVLTGSIPRWRG